MGGLVRFTLSVLMQRGLPAPARLFGRCASFSYSGCPENRCTHHA
ncbi:hypothetical protein HMPREF9347_03569 [Escherichia coli MS 124-1]|nr:hypothetical protein HMPREF9347_03569 [Escherichia coli MS 124-1]